MSIEDEIIDSIDRGMLRPLLPQAAGEAARRAMFLSEPLWNILESPEGDETWEQRVGELRADLETFVIGDEIHPKYLFLLYPALDAVWEIRSTEQDPSIRVLGLFPQKDAFVATNLALRECLAGWQSREWNGVKRKALAIWRWIFKSYKPITTQHVHDVVTGAIDGRYYKERG
jgi:hypothetical protein